jgi:hypothetical protein
MQRLDGIASQKGLARSRLAGGAIEQVETIAAGPSVKVRAFLGKMYGRGRWRKVKEVAVRL